jgi:hypothetical protein
MDQKQKIYSDSLRRAALPELLFAPDIALAVQLPEETAEAYAAEGRFGPCLFVQGRVAVLKDHFIEALRARAIGNDLALKDVAPQGGEGGAP